MGIASMLLTATRFTVLDANGKPVNGAKIYTYIAGSSTPLSTYSDSGLTTPNANPTICDSAGRAVMFLSNQGYKVVVNDAADALMYSQDNVSSTVQTGTWTPALNFGGAAVGMTVSSQTGTYIRAATLVYVEGRIVLTAKGSSTGAASVTGLPVTGTGIASSPVIDGLNFTGLTGAPYAVINGASLILAQTSATGRVAIADTAFTNTTDIRVSLVYTASS